MGAQAANKTLEQGVVSEIVSDADRNATRITVRHVLGIDTDANKAVTVKNGQTHNDILVTEAVAYQIGSTESVVELKDPLPQSLSSSRGDYLLVRAPATNKRLRIVASSEGRWGLDLPASCVRSSATLYNFCTSREDLIQSQAAGLAEKSDPPTGGASRSVKLKAGFKLKAGDRVRVNDHKYDLSNPSEGVDEVQELSFPGTAPTSGTFTLTFDGQTTAPIAFDADGPAVAAALEALPNIGAGNVTISGGPFPAAISVTFTSTLGNRDVPDLTATDVDLNPGTPPAVAVTTAGQLPVRFDVTPVGPPDPEAWPSETLLQKLRPAISGSWISVAGAARLYVGAMLELNNGLKKSFFHVLEVDSERVRLDAPPSNDFVEDDTVLIIEAEVHAQYAPQGEVVEEEVFRNLKLKSEDEDDPLLITNHVTRRSRLIAAEQDSDDGITLSNSNFRTSRGPVSPGW